MLIIMNCMLKYTARKGPFDIWQNKNERVTGNICFLNLPTLHNILNETICLYLIENNFCKTTFL